MRIGSLFSGYEGLGLAVQAVLGGELAWVSDIDPGACKILAHRYPSVPNLGDVTAVDWSQVEPVDVLTGGTPCQDLSHAGKRGGMTEGTRSNLWVAMREAIAALRPSVVVWENVGGAFSAKADSEVEFCPGCMGDPADRGLALRALGRVLGDLSDLGYDAGWHGLRAADVGAPHGRFRVFVVAHAADATGRLSGEPRAASREGGGSEGEARADLRQDAGGGHRPAADAANLGHERGGQSRRRGPGSADGGLLPTPRATDGTKGGPNQRGTSGDLMLPSAVTLLPTPAVNDMGEGKTPEAWDEWTAKMQAAHGNGNGLSIEAQRLLPTPSAEASSGHTGVSWEGDALYRPDGSKISSHVTTTLQHLADHPSVTPQNPWGIYADAIARWEALTRPAPAPTQQSKKGTPQLSPAFSEWLMGLPAGWVTDVPGITRNEALRALGNGVVPQQGAAALRFLLDVTEATA